MYKRTPQSTDRGIHPRIRPTTELRTAPSATSLTSRSIRVCMQARIYGIQSVTKIGTTNCVRGEATAPRWGSRIAGWGLGNRCVGTTAQRWGSRIAGWGLGNRCVGTTAQRWCSSITVKVATTAPPTLGLDNRRLVNHRFPCRVSRIVNRESRIATREALVDACRVSRIANRDSRSIGRRVSPRANFRPARIAVTYNYTYACIGCMCARRMRE